MTYEEAQNKALLDAAAGVPNHLRETVIKYLAAYADLRESSTALTDHQGKVEYWKGRLERAKVDTEEARAKLVGAIAHTESIP